MYKSKDNNNLNKKLKINLFRFSYFYSLLKLRNKLYITLKDKFNKFKLIKVLKKKNKINNLILKSLSYKNIDKENYHFDYFLNLKNNQDYNFINNMIKFYQNKKEKYIPFFNNMYFKSKVFYTAYLDKGNQHSKYYKKFWFFKFLLNLKLLNFKFLETKVIYYELININYFLKFLKFLKSNLLIKFLQCIKYYYNINNKNNNININILLTHFKTINNNYILTSTSDINFNKKNKKETHYWTLYLMKKKKWKTNNIYPICLDMFKDLIEYQFKNNLILNLLNFKKIKNIKLKYNIKQYVIENNNNNINGIFSKSSLYFFWFVFSKLLKKWYFFKDLLILKLNKYNLFLMKKYYFFIKIIKACLLKLLNCFKYCWKAFNKKKINVINVLRIYIFFVFYKKFIKIKQLWKSKKFSFFFKRKKRKSKSLKKHLKRNSLISKLILKFKALKKLKRKNKNLLKIKIKKRFYHRYKTLIPRFKMDKKKKEAWKLMKLERLKERLKEKKKLKKLKELQYLKFKSLKSLKNKLNLSKLKNVKLL